MNKKIRKSIIDTLAWFECINRPLSVKELFHNMWNSDCTFENFESVLFEMIDKEEIFIHKRYVVRTKYQVDRYLKNEDIREEFNKKDKRIVAWLKELPFIRGVYVVNSSAFGGQTRKSDLDLLIICKKNYIWLGRVLVTIVIELFGLRRRKNKIAGHICLSFFLAKTAMDIENIQRSNHTDIYLIYWLIWARPIVHYRNTRTLLLQNHWVRDYVPHVHRQDLSGVARFSPLARFTENILYYSGIAFIINLLLRAYLKPRAERKNKKSTAESSIIISDEVLKFHEADKRDEYFKKWKSNCEKI